MAAELFFQAANEVLADIQRTQLPQIRRAAELMTESIAAGRWVHLFGAGHAGLPVQETYPRTGSFVGFHPMLELALSWFTPVVGSSGVRQFCFLERVEGFGETILESHDLDPRDTMVVFSHSGINAVVLDVALGAKRRGLPVVAITSVQHSKRTSSRHSSGKKLYEIADVVIDSCVPFGDALVELPGLEFKVGPGSTLGFCLIIDAVVTQVAANLLARGIQPIVNATLNIQGDTAADEQMNRALKAYSERLKSA